MTSKGESRLWYLWDLPSLGLLLLFGAFNASFPLIFYLGGLHNDGSLALGAVLWFVLLLPPAGICLVLALIRIGVFWPRHIRDRKTLRRLQVGVIIALLVILGLPFTRLLPPGYKTYTWGFRKYVRDNVDVAEIQHWLETVDPNACNKATGNVTDWRGQRDDWPEPVMRMNPQFVTLAPDESGRLAIRIAWSGFDAGWGLTVGHETMEIPETQPTIKEPQRGGHISHDYGQYRLPIPPGAYVWHDLG